MEDRKQRGFAVTGSEDARTKGSKGGRRGGKSNTPLKGFGSMTKEKRAEYGRLGAAKRKQLKAEREANANS